LFPASSPLIAGRIPYTVAIEALAASQDDAIPRELVSLREEIGTCGQKLAQYRVALDSGADLAAGQRIPAIQARKLAADARPRVATGTAPAGTDDQKQIAATVTAISDLMHALRYATTEDKAEIHAGLKAGTRHSISAVRRGSGNLGINPLRRPERGDL
jgi:hypothetical protein